MNGYPAAAADLRTPIPAARAIGRVWRARSVLVVGDVMLDRYVYGQVTRISPEAPVPILSVEREVAYPGGAGNVVRNLTALGRGGGAGLGGRRRPGGLDLTGLVGGQPGVEPWLLVQGGRTTTMKTRLVAGGQHLLRTDREETAPIHPRLADRMISIARDAMAATAVTVLSDYRKGLLAGDVPARLIAAAHASRAQGDRRPQRRPDYARYAGADIIIPNRRDLSEGTGLPVTDEASVIAAAQALRARHGFGAVLVTEAPAGMTLVDAATERHFPAEAAEVYDVSGAGDTVTAVLAAGIAARLDLTLAVRLASVAAGIVVGKVGTAVARAADLLAALSPQGGTLRKVVSRQAAVEQVARWRRQGFRIGFTNGCFDMLHPGHVHLLEVARDACERLVVGLNDDAGTRMLKGADAAGADRGGARRRPGRPAQRRPGDGVRGGHARGADRRAAPGRAGEGRRLRAGRGGWRRPGAVLGRARAAGRSAARAGSDRRYSTRNAARRSAAPAGSSRAARRSAARLAKRWSRLRRRAGASGCAGASRRISAAPSQATISPAASGSSASGKASSTAK